MLSYLVGVAIAFGAIWFINLLNDIEVQQRAILKELEELVAHAENGDIR